MECNICTLTKPLEAMHKDGRTKSGYSSTCEECYQDAFRIRSRDLKRKYRADPEKSEQIRSTYREWQLMKSYKLTVKKFEAMLERQGGLCAACHADNPRWKKGWCVDHDHACCPTTPTCGKCVRGILCMPCNMTVGIMKENIEDILGVVNYLRNLQ